MHITSATAKSVFSTNHKSSVHAKSKRISNHRLQETHKEDIIQGLVDRAMRESKRVTNNLTPETLSALKIQAAELIKEEKEPKEIIRQLKEIIKEAENPNSHSKSMN